MRDWAIVADTAPRTPLHAGARCPQCDYEIGVPDAPACPECGLTLSPAVRQAIAARRGLRVGLSLVNAIVLHVAAAVVFSFAVESSAAFDGSFRMGGEDRVFFTTLCIGALALFFGSSGVSGE